VSDREATVGAVRTASRSLARLLDADASAASVLERLDEPVVVEADDVDELVHQKSHELLRIAARDLTGLDDLRTTARSLSDLGDAVLRRATTIAGAHDLVVVAMGKLGAREVNYASDLDVLFVGAEGAGYDQLEQQAQAVLQVASRCFRIDPDLRPEGRDGPLVRTLPSYRAWWDRWAQPWEFQALIKARPVAGPAVLQDATGMATRHEVWDRAFDADALRQIRSMKARAEAQVTRLGLQDRELKRGRGGIRDIEFAVQLLQLVHGGGDRSLRVPATLDALAALGDGGFVAVEDADALDDAYRFLRTVEHRLQLVDEQQVHAVPADRAARTALARTMRYRGTPDHDEVTAFDRDLARRRSTVRRIHEQLWFRPLLEAYASSTATPITDEAIAVRLAAFGFSEAERTRQAVEALTKGLSRSSRLMQQLLPLLLEWLSESPDPDLGLLGLRNLTSGARANQLAIAFRDSADAARQCCYVLGTSRMLGEVLEREPDLVRRLADPGQLRTPPRAELADRATRAVAWRDELEHRQEAARRWHQRNLVGVAARDLLGVADIGEVGRDLTAIAEATLEAALASLDPQIVFVIVALGRLGGAELSYASDLDVVFAFEGDGAADRAEAERLASELLRFVTGDTPASRIYEVDAQLRPEGRQGPLARSLHGFTQYHERWAQTWERQAMTRARPVAGDLGFGRTLLGQLESFVWRPFTEDDEREVRRMKARIERERIPADQDPDFHLKLGRGSLSDIEWTAQLLQLRHGVRAAGTMAALRRLESEGHLSIDDAAVLTDAYRFCEVTRNRLFLVSGGDADALPRQPERLRVLARSLDTSANELREQHHRVTRRARQVVERLFYGRT
jgi:glutamate-ammonia-ligase adenylyltransferase